MRINFNVNIVLLVLKYDSYFYFGLIVFNIELYEVRILDIELLKVSDLEDLNKNYIEKIKMVEKVWYIF